MGEIRIELGLSGNLCYLGIKPTLTDEQQSLIHKARVKDPLIPSRFSVQASDSAELYSETVFTADTFIDQIPGDDLEGIARKIANLLRRGGNEVELDENPKFLTSTDYLFSEKTGD